MQFPILRTGPPAALMLAPTPAPGERSGEGSGSVLPPLHDDQAQRPQPGPASHEHPGTEGEQAPHGTQGESSRSVGKYLVSPLIKTMDNGWFASSVSIRSGSGRATTDRVLRLTRLFRCTTEAALYAHSEALQWIRTAKRPLVA